MLNHRKIDELGKLRCSFGPATPDADELAYWAVNLAFGVCSRICKESLLQDIEDFRRLVEASDLLEWDDEEEWKRRFGGDKK